MATPETARRESTTVRLRVNPIRCAAFGFCAEYAPEFFTLDEWGYAWLRTPDVPEGLEHVAAQAAALCPVRAIYLDVLKVAAGGGSERGGGPAGPARRR